MDLTFWLEMPAGPSRILTEISTALKCRKSCTTPIVKFVANKLKKRLDSVIWICKTAAGAFTRKQDVNQTIFSRLIVFKIHVQRDPRKNWCNKKNVKLYRT